MAASVPDDYLLVVSFLRLVGFNWGSLSRSSLEIASLSILDVEITSLGCLVSYDTLVGYMVYAL